MSKHNFYIVFLDAEKSTKDDDIIAIMNKARDWYRLDSKFWIVYTSFDSKEWRDRLINFVNPDGNLFISKLDAEDRAGWTDEEFWKWLKEKEEITGKN